MRRAAALLVVVFLGAAAAAMAAEGDLDPGFNGGQPVLVSPGPSGSTTNLAAVAKQADGKVVVVGSTDGGNGVGFGTWVIERFLGSGQPDPSFGTHGVVELNMGQGSATGVVVQPTDQRIVVGGTSGPLGSAGAEFVRLNPFGTLDGSFGGTGKVQLSSNAVGMGTTGKLAAGADGTLFLAGDGFDSMFRQVPAIASVTSNGTPNAWAPGGILVPAAPSAAKSPALAAVAVSNGTVFFGGSFFDASFVRHGLLGAVNGSTGGAIAGFGSGGELTLGPTTAINDLLIAADGRLKAAGFSSVAGASGTGAMFASFKTSGTVPTDTAFGHSGTVAIGGVAGAPNNGNAITEANGKLFEATTAVLADNSTQIALAAVDERTGALDTALGPAGYRRYSIGTGSFSTGIADPAGDTGSDAVVTGEVDIAGGLRKGVLSAARIAGKRRKRPKADLAIEPVGSYPKITMEVKRVGDRFIPEANVTERFKIPNHPIIDALQEQAVAGTGALGVSLLTQSRQKLIVKGPAVHDCLIADDYTASCAVNPIPPFEARELSVTFGFILHPLSANDETTQLIVNGGPNDPTTPDKLSYVISVDEPSSTPAAVQGGVSGTVFRGVSQYTEPEPAADGVTIRAGHPGRRIKAVRVGILASKGSAHRAGAVCKWISNLAGRVITKPAHHGACDSPVYIKARIVGNAAPGGRVHWRLELHTHLKAGRYTEFVSAANTEGVIEGFGGVFPRGDRKAFSCPRC